MPITELNVGQHAIVEYITNKSLEYLGIKSGCILQIIGKTLLGGTYKICIDGIRQISIPKEEIKFIDVKLCSCGKGLEECSFSNCIVK